MSEVQDACQIILMTGKGAYLLGDISVKGALMIVKALNTAYLSKWKGETSLSRFRAIKGDDFLYINVSSENSAVLKGIVKEMEDHGILAARLPDLCGGDGRTQFVISASDAGKFKAFLLDHNDGKQRGIKVGMISAEDYARSGYDEKQRQRPELTNLTKSAKETLKREKETLAKRDQKEGPEKETFSQSKKSVSSAGPLKPVDPTLSHLSSAEKYGILYQEEKVKGRSEITWISQKPFNSEEKWQMVEMPDGLHFVIIPKEDHYLIPAGSGTLERTAIYKDRTYTIVEMESGKTFRVSGEQVSESMKCTDYRTENLQLKNMLRNKSPRRKQKEITFTKEK